MDCEMRPSDELMEFSVSTLWNTCTVGLVEIPDNIPVQEPKSDSIFDMPILGFVDIPDWLMSPFVSHPMPHNDADVIPPAAPAELLAPSVPEPAAPSVPEPAPAQPAPEPADVRVLLGD